MHFDDIQPLVSLMMLFPILYYGWEGIRSLASAYFPTAINCWFERDREDFTAAVWRTGAKDFPERLRALGFEPLGIKVEDSTSPFNIVRELVWTSSSYSAFASILSHSPHKIYFYTPFIDGSIALTSNAERFHEARGSRVAIRVDLMGTPENLLATHLSSIQELEAEGHTPYAEFTQASRLKANPLYFQSAPVRRRLIKHSLMVLPSSILLTCGLIFVTAQNASRSRASNAHPVVPYVNPEMRPAPIQPRTNPEDQRARIIPLGTKAERAVAPASR